MYFEIGSTYTSLMFQDVFLRKVESGLLQALTWTHICYTLDFDTGNVSLVLNGHLVGNEQVDKNIETNMIMLTEVATTLCCQHIVRT